MAPLIKRCFHFFNIWICYGLMICFSRLAVARPWWEFQAKISEVLTASLLGSVLPRDCHGNTSELTCGRGHLNEDRDTATNSRHQTPDMNLSSRQDNLRKQGTPGELSPRVKVAFPWMPLLIHQWQARRQKSTVGVFAGWLQWEVKTRIQSSEPTEEFLVIFPSFCFGYHSS